MPTVTIAALSQDQVNVLNITAAIAEDIALTMIYTDRDDITSIRTIRPKSIKRAKNGQTIIKAYDLNREDWRTFRLAAVADVVALLG